MKLLRDTSSDPVSKGAAENYFRAAASWGLFSKEGTSLSELVSGGKTSILDMSTLENENVSASAVSILAGKLYEASLEARRIYEKELMGEKTGEEKFPMVWLFIDEAHIFVPAKTESLASGVLINRCLRQGQAARAFPDFSNPEACKPSSGCDFPERPSHLPSPYSKRRYPGS